MVNLSSEKHFWWNHRILVWQEKLCSKQTTFKWSLGWSRYFHEEVTEVVCIWLSIDTNDGILSKSLGLFCDSGV